MIHSPTPPPSQQLLLRAFLLYHNYCWSCKRFYLKDRKLVSRRLTILIIGLEARKQQKLTTVYWLKVLNYKHPTTNSIKNLFFICDITTPMILLCCTCIANAWVKLKERNWKTPLFPYFWNFDALGKFLLVSLFENFLLWV